MLNQKSFLSKKHIRDLMTLLRAMTWSISLMSGYLRYYKHLRKVSDRCRQNMGRAENNCKRIVDMSFRTLWEHFDRYVIVFDNARRSCWRNFRKQFHTTTTHKHGQLLIIKIYIISRCGWAILIISLVQRLFLAIRIR